MVRRITIRSAANIYVAMPESGGSQASHLRYPDNDHLTANAEDFSLALEMAMRESLMSLSLLVPQSPVTSHFRQ